MLPAELTLKTFDILAYLPGVGLTVIKQTVGPDWDPCIALRLVDFAISPSGKLGRTNFFVWGLRSPLTLITRKLESLYTSCIFHIATTAQLVDFSNNVL